MINQNLLIAGDDGYNISRSLRLRSSASAYLSRTPASAGSRTTWTWSAWVKRGDMSRSSGAYGLFGCAPSGEDTIRFDSSTAGNQINFYVYTGGYVGQLNTTASYRDPSSWYHVVCVWDTTNATSTERMRLYVNGVRVTAFGTATYPSQNAVSNINNNVATHLGWYSPSGSNGYYDGYLTDINFIDGQALTPSSFGETDSQTGVWKPKKYSGTYGTNGFYLNFSDNSSTTTLGYDKSGNSNNWTCNNISLTAGSTYDSMTDVPTLTSESAANYATLNPLALGSYATLSNANLRITGNTSANAGCSISTIGASSGKWYFESVHSSTGNSTIGAVTSWGGNMAALIDENNIFGALGGYNKGIGIRGTGTTYGNAAEKQTISAFTFAVGDVVGVAIDADNGAVYFSVNGSWLNSGSPTSGASRTGSFHNFTPSADRVCHAGSSGYNGAYADINFGQRPFAYTPPTGFKALNTFNLPTPTIGATASTQANKYFDIKLYTGNGSTQTIGGLNFQPDLVWTKSRSTASWWHILVDAVRGAGRTLSANAPDAQYGSGSDIIPSFTSDGFSLNVSPNASSNENAQTYVAWAWKANGAGSSNTAGSITSQVSANTSSGFSIVTYTGTGASATVGHGLGVAPKMIIVKDKAVNPWPIYHASLGVQYYTLLNTTSAADNSLANYWSATAPSSTVFGLNSYGGNNTSAHNYVAYCFADVAGYSKFGSYTGNGSSDGTFVHLGFRPKFVMTKRTDGISNWNIADNLRPAYNPENEMLLANDASGTLTSYPVDFLSNGFKMRNTEGGYNSSGGTYIYMAFAENPFKYSLAR